MLDGFGHRRLQSLGQRIDRTALRLAEIVQDIVQRPGNAVFIQVTGREFEVQHGRRQAIRRQTDSHSRRANVA